VEPNRHEALLVEQVVVDDHRRLDPVRLFLAVVRMVRQPAAIDEELAVAPHPVAQRFEPGTENDIRTQPNEVFQGHELPRAAIDDRDVAAARAEEAVRAKEILLGGKALVSEPDLVPLEARKRCTVRGNNRIARTGRAERPAHHRGVGRQHAAAGLDRAFAEAGETIPLEDGELATV
jgi:hypothetical protein